MTTLPTGLRHLPRVLRTYLDAHTRGDVTTAAACFAPAAVVVDDGRTHRGREEIRDWLDRSSTAYTYTTALVSVVRRGEGRWNVTQHVAGDFPGGTVDLDHGFTIAGARIAALVIDPV